MQLEQISIYDLYGKEQDPLYQKLEQLKKDESIELDNNIKVLLNNFGIYEIVSENIHEARKKLEDCYNAVKTIMYS